MAKIFIARIEDDDFDAVREEVHDRELAGNR
jgi:hypothetical protein